MKKKLNIYERMYSRENYEEHLFYDRPLIWSNKYGIFLFLDDNYGHTPPRKKFVEDHICIFYRNEDDYIKSKLIGVEIYGMEDFVYMCKNMEIEPKILRTTSAVSSPRHRKRQIERYKKRRYLFFPPDYRILPKKKYAHLYKEQGFEY